MLRTDVAGQLCEREEGFTVCGLSSWKPDSQVLAEVIALESCTVCFSRGQMARPVVC
jgi:hypothetical protein